MHIYWLYLRNLLWPTALAVPIGVAVPSVLWTLCAAWMDASALTFWQLLPMLGVIVLAACALGVVPAMLMGAPLYALVAMHGWANFLTAGLLGALPGALMTLVDMALAAPFLFYGPLVAVALHALARRDVQTLRTRTTITARRRSAKCCR